MIEVTVHIPALDRFCDLVAAGAAPPMPSAKPAPAKAAEPKATASAKPQAEPEPQAAEPDDAAVPTIDDCKDAMKAYQAANGADALRDMLAKFGVRNVTALPVDQYAALIAACKE